MADVDEYIIGAPLQLSLSGAGLTALTLDITGDSDLTHLRPKVTLEPVYTSGQTFYKRVRGDTSVTITVITTVAQAKELKKYAEATIGSYSISYTASDNTVFETTGRIGYESRSGADGTIEVTLIPDTDWT
jgi:hypothetical protein